MNDVFSELKEAAQQGDSDAIKIILTKNEMDINAQDEDGRTILHYASSYGQIQVVECLLKQGAKFDLEDNYGETAFNWAVFDARTEVMKLFKGAEIDGKTLATLYCLIKEGNKDAARAIFVGDKRDINAQDESGRTILHYVSYYGHVEEIEFLLDRKANVNIQDCWKRTALHLASRQGHAKCVSLLLSQSDPNAKDKEGYTPLYIAAGTNRIEVIKRLLDGGARIDEKTDNGDTPLQHATRAHNIEAILVLLKAMDEKGERDFFKTCIEDPQYKALLVKLFKEGFNPKPAGGNYFELVADHILRTELETEWASVKEEVKELTRGRINDHDHDVSTFLEVLSIGVEELGITRALSAVKWLDDLSRVKGASQEEKGSLIRKLSGVYGMCIFSLYRESNLILPNELMISLAEYCRSNREIDRVLSEKRLEPATVDKHLKYIQEEYDACASFEAQRYYSRRS